MTGQQTCRSPAAFTNLNPSGRQQNADAVNSDHRAYVCGHVGFAFGTDVNLAFLDGEFLVHLFILNSPAAIWHIRMAPE